MKRLLPILALLALACLPGCALKNLPANGVESATFSLTVGPFWSQSLTVSGVKKNTDGSLTVANWNGSTSYLGVVTFSQAFHDLAIGTPAAAITPTPAISSPSPTNSK